LIPTIDFGVAQHIGKQGSRSIRGTLMYMAPEILSEYPYDNRVDLWSIGVIFYGIFICMTFVFDEIFFIECLFGRPPFSFTTIEDLIHTIKSDIPIEVKE
jgi:serine/threonine protein kinase